MTDPFTQFTAITAIGLIILGTTWLMNKGNDKLCKYYPSNTDTTLTLIKHNCVNLLVLLNSVLIILICAATSVILVWATIRYILIVITTMM